MFEETPIGFVVTCALQVGEKFRSRALKFPGLISGCTIDWFQRWPKDALIAVSTHFLASYPIVCTDPIKSAVMNTMGEFQVCVATEPRGSCVCRFSSTFSRVTCEEVIRTPSKLHTN